MLRTLAYRLYPTRLQQRQLESYLDVGRTLFNDGLEQRIAHYRAEGKSLSRYTQHADLTILRAVSPFLASVSVFIERDALNRLDLAFQHFFHRVKEKNGKAGFPRFKSWRRWNSFTIAAPGKTVVRGNRVRVSGLATTIRARNVRPPEGIVKQQRIVRRAGKWFCQLVVDDEKPMPNPVPVRSTVGIDMGLTTFATLSDGTQVENPRFYRKAERALRRAHRAVSRKVKGTRNRNKAVGRLQTTYARVSDLRSNFTHHASKEIVSKHQLIAVEDLNVKGMVRSRFGKSILDAAWTQFVYRLTYKAAQAGGQVIRVNPRGTTQDCSNCGQTVPKSLSVRVHRCPHCGLVLCRDTNAARNVLQRALQVVASGAGRAIGNACGGADCRPCETGRC